MEMLRRLGKLMKNEQGQGLTEFALVALFAVVLAGAFYTSDLRSYAKNTYEQVAAYVGGVPTYSAVAPGYEQKVSDYGDLSNSALQSISNAERIEMDKIGMANLGRAFLGKTKQEINAMLNNTNENLLTGKSFDPYNTQRGLSQGVLLFDYYIVGTGDNGAVQVKFDKSKANPEDIINWMQGNYTQGDTNVKTQIVDGRYFFSNDTIDASGGMADTGRLADFTYAVCVRCTFTFDSEGKADSVRLWTTRNTEYPKGTWVRYQCEGLDNVTVRS